MIIWFSLAAAALTALAVGMLLPALRHRASNDASDDAIARDRREQNIDIARRRIDEIDADDDAAQEARAEIESALLDDIGDDDAPAPSSPKQISKAASAAIALIVPLLGIAVYLALGRPDAIALRDPVAATAPTMPNIAAMVQQLERKLREDPDDAQRWAMAARTYTALGDLAKAQNAYRNLHRIHGDSPDLLIAWAQTEARAEGAFSAQATARIERALTMKPNHQRALWLAALAAEARGENANALAYLERLKLLVADNKDAAAAVESFISRLRLR